MYFFIKKTPKVNEKPMNKQEEKFKILLENWSRYRSEEISPALALTGLQRSLPPFTNLPRNMFFKNGLNEIWSWVTI